MSKEAEHPIRRGLQKMAAAAALAAALSGIAPKPAAGGELKEIHYVAPAASVAVSTDVPGNHVKLRLNEGDELQTAGYGKTLPLVGTRVPLKKGDKVLANGKETVLADNTSKSLQGVKVTVGSAREVTLPPKIVAIIHGGSEGRDLEYSYKDPHELRKLGTIVDVKQVSGQERTKEATGAAIKRKLDVLRPGVRSVSEKYKRGGFAVSFIAHKDGSVTATGLGVREGAMLRIAPLDSIDLEISYDGGKKWGKCPYPDTPEFKRAEILHSYRLLWSVLEESGANKMMVRSGGKAFRSNYPLD